VKSKTPANALFSKKAGQSSGGTGKTPAQPKPPASKSISSTTHNTTSPKVERVIPTKEMQDARWKQLKQSGEWVHDEGHNKSMLKNEKTGQFLQKSKEK
jgi:hypothetical protein